MRYWWEVTGPINHWPIYLKGGKTYKYYGPLNLRLDYRPSAHIFYASSPSARYRRGHEFYFHEGITYTLQSELGFFGRYIPAECVFDIQGSCVFPNSDVDVFALTAYLNSSQVTLLLKALNPTLAFQVGDLKRLPLVPGFADALSKLGRDIVTIRMVEVSQSCLNHTFAPEVSNSTNIRGAIRSVVETKSIAQLLQCLIEAAVERALKNLSPGVENSRGVFPCLEGYDALPSFSSVIPVEREVLDDLAEVVRSAKCTAEPTPDLSTIGRELQVAYQAINIDEAEEDDSPSTDSTGDDDAEESTVQIVGDNDLEKLAAEVKVHPVSVYWLLKKGIEKEGWRCIPEERRLTADRFTVNRGRETPMNRIRDLMVNINNIPGSSLKVNYCAGQANVDLGDGRGQT